MHENMLGLSTNGRTVRDCFHELGDDEKRLALSQWREKFDDAQRPSTESVRRFVSADHAVRVYLTIAGGMSGEAAIDYERISMHVQTQPDPENPYLSWLTDKLALKAAFNYARKRASEKSWRIWVAVRVYQKSASGVSKRQAVRIARQVDAFVEQWLSAHHRLVGNAVREGKQMERYDAA
jgi:hypothetical protein